MPTLRNVLSCSTLYALKPYLGISVCLGVRVPCAVDCKAPDIVQ